jgi:uncharacterized protein (TIGR00255 family)
MIRSMTAFARELHRGDEGELVWEIRTVNHRYLEAFVRMPEDLRGLETKVRERLGQRLKRGKVDCGLRYKPGTSGAATLSVNRELVRSLREAADEIGSLTGHAARPDPMELMRWPGVMQEQPLDLTPVQERAMSLLEQAIDELVATREREGRRLGDLLRERCAGMRSHGRQVRERMPRVLEEIRDRLKARLEEVLEQMDEQRLEQEMVLLAQRLDVDEEMDRLATHLDEVERVLDEGGAVGRRLDFLMQELNREVNTLTSKSSDVDITRHAVDMKVLIEQMREQIQNLE